MPCGDLLRRLVQIARPGVVTEPRPQVEHFVQRRVGEIGHRREMGHKPFKVRNDRRHLGLLQHHF